MQELITFLTNHAVLFSALVAVFLLIVMVEFIRQKRQVFVLNPLQVTQMINHQNALIIDTRPKDVYRKGHIIDAQAISSKEIAASPKKLDKFKGRPLIFVCTTGVESQKAATALIKQGYNAFSLAGGIRAWVQAQMPLIKE